MKNKLIFTLSLSFIILSFLLYLYFNFTIILLYLDIYYFIIIILVYLYIIYISFCLGIILVSEALYFVCIFWSWIHFISSPFFSFQESLFLPDPGELTYGNTLILSNAAVALGSAYSTRENMILFGAPNLASFILAWTFLSLQIKEFRNLGFYISDSVYGCIFFIISGLHFFHVIVGLIIIGIYSNFPETFDSFRFLISQDLYFTIQMLYWHFVELIWLYLYIIILSFLLTWFPGLDVIYILLQTF